MANNMKWVLIDDTEGAKTQDGSLMSAQALQRIGDAVTAQVNSEFCQEWGTTTSIRVGKGVNDIQPGEWAYVFKGQLPNAPGASAYHDVNGQGVPFALCAVTTCHSLLGPSGVSVDASHEILETAGDQGANAWALDPKTGTLHAFEMCDAVEVQSYAKKAKDGTSVQVSNWVLRNFFLPNSPGPYYDYMSRQKLPGAVAPTGPFQTAVGNKGNYQIVSSIGKPKDVFARPGEWVATHLNGLRRKGHSPHWSSRAGRRLQHLLLTRR